MAITVLLEPATTTSRKSHSERSGFALKPHRSSKPPARCRRLFRCVEIAGVAGHLQMRLLNGPRFHAHQRVE
jgi:hypothetical protein